MAPGPFTPPGSAAPLTLPAFCRVEATARPTSDSEIKFEIWIPPVEAWNGKFQGVGNGGYQGSISYAAMATALRRGYATASTDTGHSGDDVKFGQGHPEKVIDYGWRAIHIMTDTAKLIVRNAQGRFADKSYFVGCSAGGHQAMSEAQRFPDDYDGIIAGAPASNRIRQTFGFMHSWTGDAQRRRIADSHCGQARTGDQGGGRGLRRGRHAEGRTDRGSAQVLVRPRGAGVQDRARMTRRA